MSIEAWLAIASLILTFIVTPLAVLFYRFLSGLNRKMNVVHSNHLPHIELYLRLICDKLDIPYTEPQSDK